MAIDGSVFDIPDSVENARVFGYPGSRPGTKASFPKARLAILVEAGTHLIIDAQSIVLTGLVKDQSEKVTQVGQSRNAIDVGSGLKG